jgi:hypothetical protein
LTPEKFEELPKSKFHTTDQVNERVHIKPRRRFTQKQPIKSTSLDYDTDKKIREDLANDELQKFLRDYNEDT